MKNFLVLNSNDDWNLVYPVFDSKRYQIDNIFSEELKKLGYDFYRAYYKHFNGSVFKNVWKYEGEWKHLEQEIIPDVIFDKTETYYTNGEFDYELIGTLYKMSTIFKIVNSPDFTYLIGSKLHQSILFSEFLPLTVNKIEDINAIQTEDVVVKQVLGSGAKFVDIIKKEEIKKLNNNQIIQSFIDGKDENGVLKDYRFVYINNQLTFGETRQAPEGLLYTNCSKGGKNTIFEPSEMPDYLVEFSNQVANKLKLYTNNSYCVDLMYDFKAKRPYLIELNAKPGLGLFLNRENIDLDKKTENIYSKYIQKILVSILI